MAKSEIQENQYVFPYHYLPYFDEQGRPHRVRHLRWGFEYLCYQRHIKELTESFQPECVLEVGCGDGYLVGSLAKSIRRVGADLSERAIGFAKAFHPEVTFLAADAALIEEKFDVVLAVEVLEHIPDDSVAGFVRTLADRVRCGGKLVISVPSDVVAVHPKHYRHYNAALLQRQVLDVVPELRLVSTSHIYAAPRWLQYFDKLTCNRLFAFEMTALNSVIWKHVWRRARFADHKCGRHVVAVFERAS